MQFNRTDFSGFSMVVAVHLITLILVAFRYPGSALIYVTFTIVSAIMLFMGFYRQFDYGLPILSIFLWLGGWFKLTFHLYFGTSYVEPIGGFSFSADQYDELLIVGVVANIAVCVVFIISKIYIKTSSTQRRLLGDDGRPRSKMVGFPIMLGIVVIAVVVVNYFNVYLGMYQTGVVAKTIFIWPINAVFGWILSMGLLMAISILLYFSCLMGRWKFTIVFIVIFEAIISASSVSSRGLYVVHVLPFIFSIWTNRVSLKFKKKSLIFLIIITIGGFLGSGTFVNISRNYAYSEQGVSADQKSPQQAALEMASSQGAAFVSQGLTSLAMLAVDRWIGIEGIMVAVGYPEKSLELFGDLLVEKPKIGYITRYQYISNAGYQYMDANKFQFLTLPGPAGMFYLSGSLLVVFVGMALLVLLMILVERWVWVLTGNPFLCAVIGVWMANGVAQFGVAPRQLLIQLFMHCIGVVFVAAFQSWWLGSGWFGKARKSGV